MSQDPDRLRQEIEQTLSELSGNIDALTERVNPARMAGERVDRARGVLGRARDRLMGTASNLSHNAPGTAAMAGHRVSGTAAAVRDQAQGSPLAAGLIAFGIGLLAASLVLPSRGEQRLAGPVKRTRSGALWTGQAAVRWCRPAGAGQPA